ncbi:hypothetical protein RND71_038998 [Anisodus tanguticus]|uniref:Phosphoglycerate kinase n=1 Tax=Anisodus tanguticus TaxID=243964 RepID=A0AAE1R3B8_9SOLA|nr:hypothetical protein RND71_038998 [Anisodus tanguticus]
MCDFRKEEWRGELKFGVKLASLADIFVHDAILAAHRIFPFTVCVARSMKPKPAVAGFVMQKELHYLVGALANPKRPFAAIVGGSNLSDKIRLIKSLLKKVDFLLLGGGIVFTFYKAMGYSVGSSLVEQCYLKMAKKLMTKAKAKEKANRKGAIVLPSDVVIADRFGTNAERKVVPASKIPDRWMWLDIGPETIVSFGQKLDTAETIIWNGPMGVYEYHNYTNPCISRFLEDFFSVNIVLN